MAFQWHHAHHVELTCALDIYTITVKCFEKAVNPIINIWPVLTYLVACPLVACTRKASCPAIPQTGITRAAVGGALQ